MTAPGAKDEFQNTTKGFIGVIVIENGKERGVAVRPESSIWLSEDEQVLTANAPRRDEDNPFTNGNLRLITSSENVRNRRPIGASQQNGAASEAVVAPEAAVAPETAPAAAEGNTAPPPKTAREVADEERVKREKAKAAAAQKQAAAGPVPAAETGSEVSPSGNPRVGQRKAGEEVATPEAPAQAG